MLQQTNKNLWQRHGRWVMPLLSLAFILFKSALVHDCAVAETSQPYILEDAKFQRAVQLFERVRCLDCVGQSIKDSNTKNAQMIKALIWEALMEGQSDLEIEQFLLQRYGPNILTRLPDTPISYALILIPVLFLGMLIVFAYYRLAFHLKHQK